MNTTSSPENSDERRRHLHLRDIFEDAYTFCLPFIDPKQGWGNQAMTRHAYVALHEKYPELTLQEVAILVPALVRVFGERSKLANHTAH